MKTFYLIGFFVALTQTAKTQQEITSLQELFTYADAHAISILNSETQVQISASQKRAAWDLQLFG